MFLSNVIVILVYEKLTYQNTVIACGVLTKQVHIMKVGII